MVKVIATGESKRLNKGIVEFHRLLEEGEIFEVTEERFKVLNGDNKYGIKLVEKYVEEKPKTPAKKTPVKKTTAKKPTTKKTPAKKNTTKKADEEK